MASTRTRQTLMVLLITSSLLLLCTGCRSASSKDAPQSNNTGYGAQMARESERMEEAIKEGKIDTWLAPPVYLDDDTPIISIYRGPKPSNYEFKGTSMQSNLSSGSFSKVSWQRGYAYQDALLNMIRVQPNGEELIFAQTPHAFAEFLFLKPAAPKTTAVTETVTRTTTSVPLDVQTTETTHHQVHVVLHQADTAPNTQQAPELKGPTLIQGSPTAQNVANYFSTWEVAPLTRELALGCAVLRTEASRDEDGEITWRYHGELWIRDLGSDRTFKHGSPELEPQSWQLYPGEGKAQLEVVMADANGWPTRIDFIDLNTFEVRSMPTRQKLKEMGVQ